MFAPIIVHIANLTFGDSRTRRVSLSSGVQDGAGSAAAQEARTEQVADVQLANDLELVGSLEGGRAAGVGQTQTSSTVGISTRSFNRDCTAARHELCIYTAADHKKATTPVSLDISAAFDNIDHDARAH